MGFVVGAALGAGGGADAEEGGAAEAEAEGAGGALELEDVGGRGVADDDAVGGGGKGSGAAALVEAGGAAEPVAEGRGGGGGISTICGSDESALLGSTAIATMSAVASAAARHESADSTRSPCFPAVSTASRSRHFDPSRFTSACAATLRSGGAVDPAS